MNAGHDMGCVSAGKSTPLKSVPTSCVCGKQEEVKRCGKCKATSYCSKECQASHLPYHSTYCGAISELEQYEKNRIYGKRSVRQQQMDDKVRGKMMKLIGEKPKLYCCLDGKKVEVLWDTGSMVTLVDRVWLDQHFPGKEIHPVAEFLGRDDLNLRAANASEISFDGVVVMNFTLKEGEEGGVVVPVLVASQQITEPILGYNVIEHLILTGDSAVHATLQSCFSGGHPVQIDWCKGKPKIQISSSKLKLLLQSRYLLVIECRKVPYESVWK